MTTNRPHVGSWFRRAFSLVELLAVLAILAILLALGVPAIKTMIYSSEQSLAENQLRIAMTAARDAAIRSTSGDTAAVFMYFDGRTVIVPCVQVGVLTRDPCIIGGTAPTTGTLEFKRQIFVPVPNTEPIRLPRGWNVRGYAAPGSIATTNQNLDGWYDSPQSLPDAIDQDGNWVFPETMFVDVYAAQGWDAGWNRQTFMVRFEAVTGNAVLNSRENVLVLDPLPVMSNSDFRANPPYDVPENDPTLAATPESFVCQTLRRGLPLTMLNARKILGDQSPDTILTGPVSELALYDEQRLASAIGAASLNRSTNCLYADATVPTLDTSLFSGAPAIEAVQGWINAYIAQDIPNLPNPKVPLEARVFTVQKYMGQVQELSPEVEE